MSKLEMRARCLACASALVLTFVGGGAMAQSTSSAGTAVATADDSGLQAIIVTAQRRDEDLQDVPIAITAVSNQRIETAGITNLQQLNVIVSGVSSRENTGAATSYIRGIGTTASNVENPVALYVDGVYIANQRESAIDLIDVQQINVLKGPQGTLFGRNATGGVVQVQTRDPKDYLEFEAKTGIDNYATWRTSAFVGGGIADNARASITAQYVTQGEGWGANQTTGQDTYRIRNDFTVRGKLLFDLGPETELKIGGDYRTYETTMTPNFVPFPGTPATPGFPAGGDLRDPHGWVEEELTLDAGGVNATLAQGIGDLTLTSITSYREGRNSFVFDPNATPDARQRIDGITDFDNFSQELQFASSSGGPLEWVIGGYYFHNAVKANPLAIEFFGPLAPDPDSFEQLRVFGDERTDSIAGFGQVTLRLDAATSLTGGLRYSHEKRDFTAITEASLVNGVEIPSLGPPVEDSISANSWTWRLALSHDLSADMMVYASWNRGFKSGGFNVTTGSNPPYDPETLDAYEIGLKSELIDRRLRLNIGAFYYDYTNIQVARFLESTTVVQNGAQAELYGVDIDLEASFTPEIYATAGISLLDAKFKSFPDAVYAYPASGGGLQLSNGEAGGNWLPYAQPFQATVSLNYDKDVDFGNLLFNITNSYGDGFYPEANNQVRQKAYNLLSLSVTWTSRDDRFNLKLWSTNLLDDDVVSTLNTSAAGFVSTYATPPRRYGITAGVRF